MTEEHINAIVLQGFVSGLKPSETVELLRAVVAQEAPADQAESMAIMARQQQQAAEHFLKQYGKDGLAAGVAELASKLEGEDVKVTVQEIKPP